jgi:putative endonuclease
MEAQKLGEQGEILATELLRLAGYQILVTNLRSRFSEGDIVCQKGDTIILVEVKTRSSRFTDPLQAITPTKIRRLKRTLNYLAAKFPNSNIRLDAITVYWEPDSPPVLNHYQNIL